MGKINYNRFNWFVIYKTPLISKKYKFVKMFILTIVFDSNGISKYQYKFMIRKILIFFTNNE